MHIFKNLIYIRGLYFRTCTCFFLTDNERLAIGSITRTFTKIG